MQQTSTAEPRLTATPLGFGCLAKTAIHFLVQKTLVNNAREFIDDVISVISLQNL